MKRIAFFDAKTYDINSFNKVNNDFVIVYFESKLSIKNVSLCKGFDGVCVFVNDNIDNEVLDKLNEYGIHILALRCSGYNNVDLVSAYKKVHIVRVPSYSPNTIAEFTFGLILCLNRKIHKAYNRTREFNFSINDLNGFNLFGKTIGIIGLGKIGKIVYKIAEGFGMNVLCYDVNKEKQSKFNYTSLNNLFENSDIISLHIPLNDNTYHIIDTDAINRMKNNVMIINTSRGALIDSFALLDGLRNGKISCAGLDVYEEEHDIFYNDKSNEVMKDDVLTLLLSLPNVLLTSHQAYLTNEALEEIANVTIDNFKSYFNMSFLKNEVCYNCSNKTNGCLRNNNTNCF